MINRLLDLLSRPGDWLLSTVLGWIFNPKGTPMNPRRKK